MLTMKNAGFNSGEAYKPFSMAFSDTMISINAYVKTMHVHFVVMCKTLPEKKPVCCIYTRLN